MPFFGRSKNKKGKAEVANTGVSAPVSPRWQSTWTSPEVDPSEIEELVHVVTAEMKLRAEALETPLFLLPFRPSSDPSPARSFINTFFKTNASGSDQYRGPSLQQEVRLTDPAVLCSVLKWCWSRMPKGVVSWAVYESFQLGEKEAGMARNAFNTFIPLGSDSPARTSIIMDFFDLISAVAAHGKSSGLGGRKLSRFAGWWAFEHSDGGKGFEGGYRSWTSAADACSHLFFAYLRSLSPETDPAMSVIERIPRSLQALLTQTEYPPETPTLLQRSTPRVVMVVDHVSSSPFSLLRRAKHFEFRQNDRVLREYSEFDDPIDALTDECKRVLYAIASTNSSGVPKSRHGLAKPQESWMSFTTTGFADLNPDLPQEPPVRSNTGFESTVGSPSQILDINRPTTPSWGEFLSSGFNDEVSRSPSTMLLPPDKVLPPLASRTQTPSIMSNADGDDEVTPGELAAITNVELDDAFWWVWMTSLAGEETPSRKAVFGRCALIETTIQNGKWLVMEEQIKGASPDPLEGAQILEKRSRFSFSRRSKLGRRKSMTRKQLAPPVPQVPDDVLSVKSNRMTIGADQQEKIRAAAAQLSRRNESPALTSPTRRGRQDENAAGKTVSTFTMGLQSDAAPAMKWANSYDKDTIRSAYLGSNLTGTGKTVSTDSLINGSATHLPAMTPLPEDPVQESEPVAEPIQRVTSIPQFTAPPESVKETDLPPPPVPPVKPLSPEQSKDVPIASDSPVRRKPEVSAPKEDNPAILAAKMALEGRAVSPESVQGNNKLKKQQPAQGGFKKFFSRNKDKSKRQSTDYHPGALSAANDAAMGRKLASIRQEGSEADFAAPVMPASQGQYGGSEAALSRVDTEEQEEAEIAFSRFDQGPPIDMPVVNPRESVDNYSAAEPPTVNRYSPRNPQPEHYAPPPPPPSAPQSDAYHSTHERIDSIEDVQSEATMDDGAEGITAPPAAAVDSSKDRWERIRENAARRAANARANGESSSISRPNESGRTDDGETSGEETIESRVARIKARVAELTGNMESSSLRH